MSSTLRRSVSPRVVLAVAAAGVFMDFVDSTIVNVAFPDIQETFPDASVATLSWVFNAYSVTLAAFLVSCGRLGDLLGRKRLFEIGVLGFSLASALCAVAWSP